MALAVAEVGRVRRSEPDFARLERMVRDALVRDGWMTAADDVIPYRRLGLAINYSHAAIYNVLVKHSRAQREMLIALADHFDESREEWLEAGGYDVESLPQDRGWTTRERELARSFADVKNGEFQDWMEWFATLTPERKKLALRTSLELRSRHEPRGGD